jgi:dynactin complex subunit
MIRKKPIIANPIIQSPAIIPIQSPLRKRATVDTIEAIHVPINVLRSEKRNLKSMPQFYHLKELFYRYLTRY